MRSDDPNAICLRILRSSVEKFVLPVNIYSLIFRNLIYLLLRLLNYNFSDAFCFSAWIIKRESLREKFPQREENQAPTLQESHRHLNGASSRREGPLDVSGKKTLFALWENKVTHVRNTTSTSVYRCPSRAYISRARVTQTCLPLSSSTGLLFRSISRARAIVSPSCRFSRARQNIVVSQEFINGV